MWSFWKVPDCRKAAQLRPWREAPVFFGSREVL